MLGGAATHFALAASLFDEVRVVGPVGGDFGDADIEVARARAERTSTTSRSSPDGKTFFWRGEYGWDLNSRETLDTAARRVRALPAEVASRPRATATFSSWPTSCRAPASRARPVRGDAFVGARLDEPVDRGRPQRSRRGDRARRLPDPQRRRAAPADRPAVDRRRRPRGAGHGSERWSIAKQGEYGAVADDRRRVLLDPAFPLDSVVDPTGAGDAFAGGAAGYLARRSPAPPTTGRCAGDGLRHRASPRSTSRSSEPSGSPA